MRSATTVAIAFAVALAGPGAAGAGLIYAAGAAVLAALAARSA